MELDVLLVHLLLLPLWNLLDQAGYFLLMSMSCVRFSLYLGCGELFILNLFRKKSRMTTLPVPRATSLAFYLDPHTEIEDEEIDESDELYPFSEEYEDEYDDDE